MRGEGAGRIDGETKGRFDAELRNPWRRDHGMFFSNLIMYFIILTTRPPCMRTADHDFNCAGCGEALKPWQQRAHC